MHSMQVQGSVVSEAMQAVRPAQLAPLFSCLTHLFSFELGGEKKTKGAAIQFVSSDRPYCPRIPPDDRSPSERACHRSRPSLFLLCNHRMISLQHCHYVLSAPGTSNMQVPSTQSEDPGVNFANLLELLVLRKRLLKESQEK